MWKFASISMIPLLLIPLATFFGGAWVIVALIYQTILAGILDESLFSDYTNPQKTRGAQLILILLSIGHFAILPLSVWALANTDLNGVEKLGIFIATGLFLGQISNSNGHELIHKPNTTLRRLGMWIFTSLCFGHHTSAHPLVHHVHVATPKDPNTARMNDSYYRFAPRAWIGSFWAGMQAETSRHKRITAPIWRHPYVVYIGGALAFMALAFWAGGLLWYLGLCAYAQAQLLLSDYVQHYGLERAKLPNGKYEPVNARHSWNAPHWFTSHMMLNAPRHSDHHTHPLRPYPELRLDRDMPMLPYSLPAMATLALWPRMWKRVMHRMM